MKKQHAISITAKIEKTDDEKRMVFGWFSVVEEKGKAVKDAHGDVIKVEELEKTAYDFVLDARMAGEMHKRMGVGRLVESMMFTKEKQKALGINLGKVGWWGGFKIDDEEVWAGVKSGKYPAFSIGGTGYRRDVK